MPVSEARKQWEKENTVYIPMRLQKTTDADILKQLEGAAAIGIRRQTELKRLIRLGMEAEKNI